MCRGGFPAHELVHAAGWAHRPQPKPLVQVPRRVAGLDIDRQRQAARPGVFHQVLQHLGANALADLFAKLAKDPSRVPALLSSHPSSAERLAAVQAAFPKDRTYPPLPYDYRQLRGSAK